MMNNEVIFLVRNLVVRVILIALNNIFIGVTDTGNLNGASVTSREFRIMAQNTDVRVSVFMTLSPARPGPP